MSDPMRRDRVYPKAATAARIDHLSGPADRAGLTGAVEPILRRAARDDLPVALALFDLDLFKRINDDFGRPMGDEVLRVFSRSVMRHIRPSDAAGRLGGEAFVVVMPGVGVNAGMAVAERIRVSFAEAAAVIDGIELDATVSAGVTVARGAALDLETMIEVADGALCRAKNFGRNRVVVGKPRRPEDRGGGVVVRVA